MPDEFGIGDRQKHIGPAQAIGGGFAARGLAQRALRTGHRLNFTMEVVLDCAPGLLASYVRRASMRFVTYQSDGGPHLGVVQGDRLLPLPGLDMLRMIEA